MATSKAAALALLPPAAQKLKPQGLKMIPPLSQEVDALDIQSEQDYADADNLLGMIQAARTGWDNKLQPIIRPISDGLQALYALSREIDRPLGSLEKIVKAKMQGWQLAKVQQRRLAEAETERLRVQAEAARTAPMKAKVEKKLELAVAAVAEAAPTKGEHSGVRMVKKYRIIDSAALLAGIVDGDVPSDVVEFDTVRLNHYFKHEPGLMKTWKGVEFYEEPDIYGRR